MIPHKSLLSWQYRNKQGPFKKRFQCWNILQNDRQLPLRITSIDTSLLHTSAKPSLFVT